MPGGGGGGPWIPTPNGNSACLHALAPRLPRQKCESAMHPLAAERALKLEQSMSLERERSREHSVETMEILSPGSPGSPGSVTYPRDLLTSTSSMRLIKEKKPKPPTSGDLAKLSMYLTAQQHNKLKQHIQQVNPSILGSGTEGVSGRCIPEEPLPLPLLAAGLRVTFARRRRPGGWRPAPGGKDIS